MYGGADTAICKCTIKKDGIVQPTRTIKNRIKNRIKSISTKKTNMTSEIRTLPEMNINSNYISSSPFDDNKMKQLIKYMYDNVSTKDPDRQNIFVQAYEKIKKEKIPFTYYDKDITQKYKEIKKKLRPGFFNIIKRKRQVMPA